MLTKNCIRGFILAVLSQSYIGCEALPSLEERGANDRHVQVPPCSHAQILLSDAYGYSIEPDSVFQYASSDLAHNLLETIGGIIGKQPPLRIGGTTSDEIVVVPEINTTSSFLENQQATPKIQLAQPWYDTWNNYFPRGTDFVYTLNFANETDRWVNALKEAGAVLNALGSKLKLFELGNEVDHYIAEGWRAPGWDCAEYAPQWRTLRSQVEQLPEYQSVQERVLFQAAVFADPPMVPDQQAEIDDFGIVNLTEKAHLVNSDGTIGSYSVHLYPQSTCDATRRARLSLDLLCDHLVLYKNVSQYIPSQAAAIAAGAPLVFGETNSVSCGGQSGISDTFGAALWSADYVLMAASLGIPKVYFHMGDQSQYSAFTPLPYTYMNENLTAGVRANFYSHLFMAHVISNPGGVQTVNAISSANSSDFSGYAIYDDSRLSKLVFLDMGVWNSSQGTSNPSTLSSTDSHSVSPGQRPVRTVSIQTSWPRGAEVEAIRMQAPGSNAKSDVTVSGVSVNAQTGKLQGQLRKETHIVGPGGVLLVRQEQAEALLLQLV